MRGATWGILAGIWGALALASGCNLVAGLDDFQVAGGAGGTAGTGGRTTGSTTTEMTGGGGTTTTEMTGGGGTTTTEMTGGGGTGGTTTTTSGDCEGCPEPTGECQVATCDNMVCGAGPAPDGTDAKTQTAG